MFGYEGRVPALLVGQQYLGDMVVGKRIDESRELNRSGSDREESWVEAKVSHWIKLENRGIGIVSRGQGFRYGGVRQRDGILAK